MSVFTFTNPITGQKFDIETPATFTEAQARQIFEQQLNAGSLVGLKPGDVINSAAQLAGGLKSAASQVSQTLLGIAGSAQGALTGGLDKAKQAASSLPVQDLVSSAQSVASKTLSSITTAVNNLVPTNPINIADLAKQASSLVPMQGLDQVDVRAAMSQATKLIGQASNVLSNSKGLGQFGFDATQLERAGFLKPGTASTYLADGVANLTSVLNSPAVWTGINGVTNVDKLLSSVPTQNLIQQDLMSQGLNAVKNLGIPINKLDPSALAGTALNAAKSITDTMSWAKGLPLPTNVKGLLDVTARAGAFAVNFASQVANDAVLQQDPATPATDTVNRETVNAAVTRVTGSNKIPEVDYVSRAKDVIRTFEEYQQEATPVIARWEELLERAVDLAKIARPLLQGTDVAALVDSVEQYKILLSDLLAVEGAILSLKRKGQAFYQKYQMYPPPYTRIEIIEARLRRDIQTIEGNNIKKLRNQIETLTGQQ